LEDEVELEMLHHTRRRLREAGFEPTEISNYARPNEECRHNLLYWNGGNYLGLALPPPSIISAIAGKTPTWANGKKPSPPTSFPPWMWSTHFVQRASELIMLQLRLPAASI